MEKTHIEQSNSLQNQLKTKSNEIRIRDTHTNEKLYNLADFLAKFSIYTLSIRRKLQPKSFIESWVGVKELSIFRNWNSSLYYSQMNSSERFLT